METWIEAETDAGIDLTAAVEKLNNKLRMHVTKSRIAEWCRGRYVPSQAVLSYMLSQCLHFALREAGIVVSREQFDVLTKQLWHTKEQDGRTYIHFL